MYRDGIRVYDYGEPENDRPELDARRTDVPARRTGNRLVAGAVRPDSAASRGPAGKTNREGFAGSPSYVLFRSAVQSAIRHVACGRNRDKDPVRAVSGEPRDAAGSVAGSHRRLRERVRPRGMFGDPDRSSTGPSGSTRGSGRRSRRAPGSACP